jgi:uncharacterized protein (TIGR03118 family)
MDNGILSFIFKRKSIFMKTIIKKSGKLLIATSCSLFITMIMNSCKKDSNNTPVITQSFTQTDLVASSNTFTGARVDPNLINGWGIAFGPSGVAWISSEGMGVSTVYDKTGAQILAPVAIPSPAAATGGAPTGQVFNATTDFILTGGNPAKFIFAGTDGVISAWNTGTAAVKVVDRSATSIYTGLAIGANGSINYLYGADFKSGKIDVFDKNFALVSMTFTDPTLPAGYSPFNIQNVGGQLYVMYAKINATTFDEVKGSGLGYVDIYNTDGSFVKRFVSQGALNAPWGVVQAPESFLTTGSAILIGNFGDGRINVYSTAGNFMGNLQSGGTPITIDGLWGISFAPATATTVDPNWLFFAAGPGDETQGLFGYIK